MRTLVLIRDMDFRSGLGEDLRKLAGRGLIREPGVQLADVTEPNQGVAFDLGMIGDQEDASGMGDDRLGHLDFAVIVVEQGAIEVDAADTDHADIDLELRDHAQGRFPDNAFVSASDQAARDDDFTILISG